MPRDSKATSAETQVRRALSNWIDALCTKDLDRLMSCYAPDVRVFDLAPPLQRVGTNSLRDALADWFTTFVNRIGYEVRDMDIAVGDDVAVCNSFGHITGRRTDGGDTDVWTRATVCLKRVDGRWLVTHEHSSVPFYMDGSFKAAVDLRP